MPYLNNGSNGEQPLKPLVIDMALTYRGECDRPKYRDFQTLLASGINKARQRGSCQLSLSDTSTGEETIYYNDICIKGRPLEGTLKLNYLSLCDPLSSINKYATGDPLTTSATVKHYIGAGCHITSGLKRTASPPPSS